MGKRLIALSLLLFTATPALAVDMAPSFTGADLYKMCASKYDTDYGYCAGYVSAIAGLLQSESVQGYRACNLGMVRSQQFVDIFRSYGGSFPEQLGGTAEKAVAASLSRAFPCGR